MYKFVVASDFYPETIISTEATEVNDVCLVCDILWRQCSFVYESVYNQRGSAAEQIKGNVHRFVCGRDDDDVKRGQIMRDVIILLQRRDNCLQLLRLACV